MEGSKVQGEARCRRAEEEREHERERREEAETKASRAEHHASMMEMQLREAEGARYALHLYLTLKYLTRISSDSCGRATGAIRHLQFQLGSMGSGMGNGMWGGPAGKGGMGSGMGGSMGNGMGHSPRSPGGKGGMGAQPPFGMGSHCGSPTRPGMGPAGMHGPSGTPPHPGMGPRGGSNAADNGAISQAAVGLEVRRALEEMVELDPQQRKVRLRELRMRWHPDKNPVLRSMANEVCSCEGVLGWGRKGGGGCTHHCLHHPDAVCACVCMCVGGEAGGGTSHTDSTSHPRIH
jgi:hypothetical protein